MLRTWVRDERRRRGMTQEDLAVLVGVKQAYISQIETGERQKIGGDVLIGLARAFEMTVDELVLAAGLGPSSEPDELARAVAAARPYLSAELIQAIEQSGQQMPADVRADLARGLQAELERARRRAEFDSDAGQEQPTPPGGGGLGEGALLAYAAPTYASGYEGPRAVHDAPAPYGC